jgi:Xaa-Pro aminopeptidase
MYLMASAVGSTQHEGAPAEGERRRLFKAALLVIEAKGEGAMEHAQLRAAVARQEGDEAKTGNTTSQPEEHPWRPERQRLRTSPLLSKSFASLCSGTGATEPEWQAFNLIEFDGVGALRAQGIQPLSGQVVMEHAREIKGPDEIRAMRCALATCETAAWEMQQALVPGIAECELWATLHRENIARGGEWIETRILNSGPRTNPWMQECGPRVINAGDLLAFDTDMVSVYGMCADISRTWLGGDNVRPSDEQRRLYQVAYEHISRNFELLKPGVGFTELTERGHRLPEEFRAQRYGLMIHGICMWDEYPCIYYPEDFIEGAFDYVLQPGMTLCVEAYIGAVGGMEGVKPENQVLITESGVENLTRYPFDERLLAS